MVYVKNDDMNAHILCFDPIFKKQTSEFQGVTYEGSNQPIEIVKSVKKIAEGTVLLSYYNSDAELVEVEYCTIDGENRIPLKDGDAFVYKTRKVAMVKGSDDYWRVSIDPGIGYHDIFYYVDGVKTIHTQAPYGYDGDSLYNFIDLTENSEFQLQDVPHGRITRELYHSSITNRLRACWVYTPPEYETSNESYPTLYVQHGGGEDEICWFQSGKLDILMDNLIATGKVNPMIIIANNGYAMKELDDSHIIECKLDEIIVNECLPFIERQYRTKSDRKYRAVAGLSMGGGHARRLAFAHPEVFANVGMFSSFEGFPTSVKGYDFSSVMKDSDSFNSLMDQVIVTCGDGDPRIVKTKTDVEYLQHKGYDIVFQEFMGHHEWNVWRESISFFIKKLFKETGGNVNVTK